MATSVLTLALNAEKPPQTCRLLCLHNCDCLSFSSQRLTKAKSDERDGGSREEVVGLH